MRHLDATTLRKKVTFSIVLIATILILVTVAMIGYLENQIQTHKEQEFYHQLDVSIEHAVKYFIKNYSYRARLIVSMPEVHKFLSMNEREALYEFMKPKWELFKEEEPGILMHFHRADGTSFLRMHQANQYDDQLQELRPMIKKIHQSHQPLAGYETGKYGTLYRIITPIFDAKNTYIGAFEIGLNPQFLLDAIYSISGYCGLIYLKDGVALNDSNGIYHLQTQLDANKFTNCHLGVVPKVLNKKGVFESNQIYHKVKQYPLNDFNNKEVAKMIFLQDVDKDSFFNNQLLIVMFLIIFGLLVSMVYYIRNVLIRYQTNVSNVFQNQMRTLEKNAQQLQRNKTYLQSIFDASSDILIITSGNHIFTANDTMLNFLEYETLETFKAHHDCICDLFIAFEDCVTKKMGTLTWLEYIMSHKEKVHKVCLLKGNKKHTFIVNANVIEKDEKKPVLVAFTDITSLEEKESKNRHLKSLFNNVINSNNNMIFVKDSDFKYIACNGEFERFTGRTKETIIGKTDYDIFENEVADFFRTHDVAMLNTKQMRSNYEWVTYPDGSRVYLYTVKSPLRDESGAIYGLVGNSVDLTKQKQLDDELTQYKQRFELFMNTIPAYIAIKDSELNIIYANKPLHEWLGCDNLVGKNAYDFMPKEIADKISADDKTALEFGKSDTIETSLDRGGNERKMRTLTFRIRQENDDLLIGTIIIDITEQYLARSALEKSQMKLKEAQRIAQLGHWEYDLATENLTWSDEVYNIFGWNKAQRVPSMDAFLDAIHPEDRDRVQKAYNYSVTYDQPYHIVHRIIRHNDKEERYVEERSIQERNEEGVVVRSLGTVQDITQQKKLQMELESKEKLLLAQSRQAAMGEMIGMIAHQWRQPITTIAMNANNILADIALDTIETGELKTISDDILTQTQYLSQTIDDFRNFFKPNKNKELTQICSLVHDAIEMMHKSFEYHNIDVEVICSGKPQVVTYSRELLQVYLNILKNAKEVLQDQDVAYPKIVVRIFEKGQHVIIEIEDNAGGVDKENIERIFEPYFSTKDEKVGTGLGLYMSKTIVEKHMNGTLTVENRAKGACFCISLDTFKKEDNE